MNFNLTSVTSQAALRKKTPVETHLVSAERASLQTAIPSREEKGDPGQREGDDEGHEEAGCVKAMVWNNLRGQE